MTRKRPLDDVKKYTQKYNLIDAVALATNPSASFLFEHAKSTMRSFYRSAKGIFGEVGRLAPEEVV